MTNADAALRAVDAAWAEGNLDGVVAHLSAAIRALTADGDTRRAAMTCAQLGSVYGSLLGNLTASRAWFARATRLVEDEPPCIEQGWVAVAPMGCDVDDPDELRNRAELALDRARRFGSLDLEAKALADGGLARVRLGDVDGGMAMLDEAMALVCGPAEDVEVRGKSACSFFTACYTSADYRRADSWSGLLRRQGVIADARGAPIFVRSHCDSVHAALLVQLGRWGEAEQILSRAIADFEAINGGASWHPAIALAELRIHQGRLTDAEALLLGKDAWLEALLPAVRLHLARGEYELAIAAAGRGLRAIRRDRIRAGELMSAVVDARLALGDVAAAHEAADEMERRCRDLATPALHARCLAARARVRYATGEVEEAIELVGAAIDAADAVNMPWYRATLLLEEAQWRDASGDRAAAVLAASAARHALHGLDVSLSPEQVGVLARIAPDAPAPPLPGLRTATLGRDRRGWQLEDGHTRAFLADSKGLRYLHELVARPGVERHVFDLVDAAEGVVAAGEGPDRRHLGDAGELLDGRARAVYRREVERLRGEVHEAEERGDFDRADALQDELNAFVTQLAQAYGLGGRVRLAGAAAEKARVNVTRAIRAATSRVAEALPEAGAALDRAVRTGTYCCYEPSDDEQAIRWIVQS